MDLFDALTQLERLYEGVLRLAEEQESCLSARQLERLPTLLARKDGAVAEAQSLLLRLKAGGEDLGAPSAQEGLVRIGALLARVVAAEERCRALAPARPTTAPRAHAAAAYGRASR